MLTMLVVIFIISTLVQAFFWIVQLDIVNRHDENHQYPELEKPSVSIVIAVKDEYDNVQELIPSLTCQDYPNFNIIFVDDHSSDETLGFLKQQDPSKITVLELPELKNGKKAALTFGIQHCTASWILFTDADCKPVSPNWINEMMKKSSTCDVILGYSPSQLSGNFLSHWINYETWFIAMQYLSAAIMNISYMAVGRNMAFKRSLFNEVGGYDNHPEVKSGSDDLFISGLPENTKVGIAIYKDSWVLTQSSTSIWAYNQQKRRHLTTAPYYKLSTKLRLAVISFSQLAWYISLFFIQIPIVIACGLSIRFLVLYLIGNRSRYALRPQFHLYLLPVYDFLLMIFYFLISPTLVFSRKNW